MRSRIYILIVSLLCLASAVTAQTSTAILKGKVTDRSGEPLIGAHVQWKDANNATISDKLHATQNTLNNKNIATVKNGIVYHSTVTK